MDTEDSKLRARRRSVGHLVAVALNALVIVGASMVWMVNQFEHGVLMKARCIGVAPPRVEGVSMDALGQIEGSLFPPTLYCEFARWPGGTPPVRVDMYPHGAEIFWWSSAVIVGAVVFGVWLRRRAVAGHASNLVR